MRSRALQGIGCGLCVDASVAGMKAVTANRTYESGERKIEANILVGMQSGAAWTPGNQEGYKMETPDRHALRRFSEREARAVSKKKIRRR